MLIFMSLEKEMITIIIKSRRKYHDKIRQMRLRAPSRRIVMSIGDITVNHAREVAHKFQQHDRNE